MRCFALWMLGLCVLGTGCSDDDPESSPSSSSGTTIVGCHTGTGPNNGCGEVAVPNAALQAHKDACVRAGSQVFDQCPVMGANAKCTNPSASYPLPNLLYWYGLVDANDFDDARQDCEAMGGTFQQL